MRRDRRSTEEYLLGLDSSDLWDEVAWEQHLAADELDFQSVEEDKIPEEEKLEPIFHEAEILAPGVGMSRMLETRYAVVYSGHLVYISRQGDTAVDLRFEIEHGELELPTDDRPLLMAGELTYRVGTDPVASLSLFTNYLLARFLGLEISDEDGVFSMPVVFFSENLGHQSVSTCFQSASIEYTGPIRPKMTLVHRNRFYRVKVRQSKAAGAIEQFRWTGLTHRLEPGDRLNLNLVRGKFLAFYSLGEPVSIYGLTLEADDRAPWVIPADRMFTVELLGTPITIVPLSGETVTRSALEDYLRRRADGVMTDAGLNSVHCSLKIELMVDRPDAPILMTAVGEAVEQYIGGMMKLL